MLCRAEWLRLQALALRGRKKLNCRKVQSVSTLCLLAGAANLSRGEEWEFAGSTSDLAVGMRGIQRLSQVLCSEPFPGTWRLGDSFPISVLQEHGAQGQFNIVASKLCSLGASRGDPAAVLSAAQAQENWMLLLAYRREVTPPCGTFCPGGQTRVHVSDGRQMSVTEKFPTVFTKYRVCFSPVTSGSWRVLGWWCQTSDIEGPGSFPLLAPPSLVCDFHLPGRKRAVVPVDTTFAFQAGDGFVILFKK